MRLFLAGVPGGVQIEREKEMRKTINMDRLISFFHIKQGMITLLYYKEIEDGG